VLTRVDITGEVKVLFVSVSVVALPTSVSVLIGRVKAPVFVIVDITGEVKVLFVSVSVVALPTSVSVLVGRVKAPVFVIVDITGDVVNVLIPDMVCAVFNVTKFVILGTSESKARVPDVVGKINVPVFKIDDIVGEFRVLFSNVSVVLRPTKVSVLTGRVSVPVLTIVLIMGESSLLFVRV
jgi:hypothetical protein